MKILIDMNLSPDWAIALQNVGIEAAHWSTLGDPSAPDTVIFGYAARHDFVIFTHDLDFGAILAVTRAAKPSVIQVRTQDALPTAIGDLVILAIRQFEGLLESGALLTIDPSRHRVRVLPL
ncbi:MAG: DUF5615 family PIN-like protein [Saprospiraceae bacterium]